MFYSNISQLICRFFKNIITWIYIKIKQSSFSVKCEIKNFQNNKLLIFFILITSHNIYWKTWIPVNDSKDILQCCGYKILMNDTGFHYFLEKLISTEGCSLCDLHRHDFFKNFSESSLVLQCLPLTYYKHVLTWAAVHRSAHWTSVWN